MSSISVAAAYPWRTTRQNPPQAETFEEAYERLYPPEYETYPGPEVYPAPPAPYASSSPLYMPYTPSYVPGLPSAAIKPDSAAFAPESDTYSAYSSSSDSTQDKQYKSIRMQHPSTRLSTSPPGGAQRIILPHAASPHPSHLSRPVTPPSSRKGFNGIG